MKNNNHNIESWQCPEDCHADFDGLWEIGQFKKIAEFLLQNIPNLQIDLNTEDYSVIHITVTQTDGAVSEIYVNRADDDPERPKFSLFFGDPENEWHTTELNEVLAILLEP